MSTDTPRKKSMVPHGTSIYLAPNSTIWRWAARRLEALEDKIMVACRRGDMKRVDARVWIAKNIETLENRFMDYNERSIDLLNDIVDLESPVKPPDILECDPKLPMPDVVANEAKP